ncbi:MAG: glycosyltransferase [Bacteroidales bacterium]|nr:glycosyltransferase [Bacteroidales bacterium]
MLSVCIPVYNHDVRRLVEELLQMSASIDDAVEIVCIDDCSDASFHVLNSELSDRITYVRLEANVGRSRIRNLFTQYAKGEVMLFLDCDVRFPDTDFLKRYLDAYHRCGMKEVVIYGGKCYQPTNEKCQQLKYNYAIKNECRSIAERQKDPYRSFITTCFMISRSVFDKVSFDERIVSYGHEDTLFGFCLLKKGIPILHIDNNVLIVIDEDDTRFLKKSEEAVHTLAYIYTALMQRDKEFAADVRLLSFYERLNRYGLSPILVCVFSIVRKPLRFLLLHGVTNSKVFNFYKLGVLLMSF